MRIVFAGTPAPAVPSLTALAASAHEVVGVVTRTDAPLGRKRVLTPSPVAQAAGNLGLPVIKADRLDADATAAISSLAADLGVIVAYGGLVREPLLSTPRHGWINLHFSLLPAWRGAAPVQHALMAGDDVTGASTFLLEEGLDTGPVFGTMTEAIGPTDTSGDLLTRLAEGGASLLVSTLDALANGDVTPIPQPRDGVSLAPKIQVDDVRLDFSVPAFAVDRRIRGASPAPGGWAMLRGERVKLLRSRLADADGCPPLTPGELHATKKQVFAGALGGVVELLEVQPVSYTHLTLPTKRIV